MQCQVGFGITDVAGGRLTGDVRPTLLILFAAVGVLLLVAAVNVAGLVLLRGLERARELAVRAALGAGRSRVIRQLATESVLLGVAGGVLGLLLAHWGLSALVALAPAELPRAGEIALNARAVGLALALALLAALFCGLVPAFSMTRQPTSAALRSGTRAGGADRGARRLRHGLVVVQLALTLTLLAGAGLLVRSLAALQALDTGLAPDNVALAQLTTPQAKYPDAASHRAALDRIVEAAGALPGVTAVAPVLTPPFPGRAAVFMAITAEGQSAEEAARNPLLNYESATESLFPALGLEIAAGRAITRFDRATSDPVVVVSETLAATLWPGADAVGQRLKWGRPDSPGPWRQVGGVVADARYRTFEEVQPTIYVPAEQGIPVKPGHLAVRSSTDAALWLPALRNAVADVDPDMHVVGVASLTGLLDAPLVRPRFNSILLILLAGLAAVLSAVGIYGTIACQVRMQTREIGIRMALGADARDAALVVLRQFGAVMLPGLGLGTLLALAGTRALRSLLFEISPNDPLSFTAGAAFLALVGLCASLIPALRAARVDPMVAIRSD